jgi:hypothetical protein
MAIIRDPFTDMSNRYNKYSFFFRTRKQFEAAEDYVVQLNNLSSSKYGMSNGGFFTPDNVGWYCQHKVEPLWRKIPKKTPGRKKYLFTMRIDKRLDSKLEEDYIAEMVSYGMEPADLTPNKPKYKESDLTRVKYRLSTVEHFKKLVKLLNKDYGNGNWHLRGQRKILRKLHEIEMVREHGHLARNKNQLTPDQIENGLLIDVCVVGEAPTLERKLFKLELMK